MSNDKQLEYWQSDALELLEAGGRSKATTKEELAEDIFKLVAIRYSRYQQAIKLQDLNRRFGSTATLLGTTVRQCISLLVILAKVDIISRKDTLFVFDAIAVERDMEGIRRALGPKKDAEGNLLQKGDLAAMQKAIAAAREALIAVEGKK